MTMNTLAFRRFNAAAQVQFSAFAAEALEGDYWVVTNPFVYYLGDKGSDTFVRIPNGYLTDGASVPRIFWNIIPPWGKYGQAAILHDYLCEYLQVETAEGKRDITRKECDAIFLEAMLVLGVPKAKARMIHSGVALFRFFARVTKPSFDPKKFAVEEALRKRFATHGNYE